MKSPEEYFQQQVFSADIPPDAKPGEFTEAELAFMEKYMGVDAPSTLKKIGLEAPRPESAPVQSAPAAASGTQQPQGAAAAIVADELAEAAPPPPAREEALDDVLKRESQLLMVGFFLGTQELVVPTLAVQEVIRHSAPAKLPTAPSFVAGVINLRGKVTPLIRLRDMLGVSSERNEDQFIIVCRRHGLQLGLMIDRIRTMYRVSQSDIDWAVETHLGSVDYISGLLKLRDELIGIVAVDAIVDTVIQK